MGAAEIVIIVLLGLTLLAVVLLMRRVGTTRTAAALEGERIATSARQLDSRREELQREDHQLALKSEELAAREKGLGDRAVELEARTSDLATATRALQSSREEFDAAVQRERGSLLEIHEQLSRREEVMTRREQRLEEAQSEQGAKERALADRESAVVERERAALDQVAAATAELERISGLGAEAAREEVLQQAERAARLESTRLVRDIERDTKREADALARKIIVTSIQRLAAEQTADAVVTALHLPSEDMKGRIIGREGRNIRTFEQVTGVNVLIDDTPETVLLSSFDPVRREVARVTLEALVADGRIQPGRIEEMYERSVAQVAERCQRAAEDALAEVGITDLAPDLVPVLGSLKYRTSYGQNVLGHLVETAHLAAMMAAELGLDPTTSKRAAFLHDIGKALTHEVEGPHAEIGAELCRRHGEHEDVVHAIAAHHNEVEPRTVEALLVQAADAISGSRPGARRESLESHMRRLTRLEDIAMEQPGVDRAFAMQAGRELRIMVLPEEVDDLGAQAMARDVARTIESELTYPGQIRVTVVRESRATQTAH